MPNAGLNPDHGYTTFDNMGWSLIMALQILTKDFWENVYNKINRSSGAQYVPYFVIGIFFCAFYLMNLVLAMVYLSYEQELSSDGKEVRLLRLAKSWKTMNRLMMAIARSIGPVGNITLILGVIIYIFAVLGMKIFGKDYKMDKFGDSGVPRWNFSDIWHAFMMVFRVLSGEWIEPLWDCMRVTNAAKAIPYFLTVLVIGNFLVLNLFVTLVVNAFDFRDKDDNSDGVDGAKFSIKKIFKTRRSCLLEENYRGSFRPCKLEVIESKHPDEQSNGVSLAIHAGDQDGKEYCKMLDNVINIESSNKTIGEGASFKDGVDSPPSFKMERIKEGISENGVVTLKPVPSVKIKELYIEDCLPEYCACVDCQLCRPLSTESISWLKFRGRVLIFVEKKYFDWFILFMVLFSSFMLISLACLFENKNLSVFRSLRTLRALRPLRAISRLEGMKVVVNALFAAIPGIANVLVVSVLFWLIFSILGVHLFAGKFYKCVDEDNAQLPASVIASKAECMNRTIDGYRWINSNVNFDNVLAGFLALMQVATFEGWMEVMKDAVDSTKVSINHLCRQQLEEYIQSNEAAERAARTAKRILRRTAAEDKADPFKGLLKYRNSLFEYIGVSSAQLLMRSTTTNDDTNSSASLGYLSRWIVDKQPKFENNLVAYCFFVAFIIVGSFFVLNLFVGVIIDNFNTLKKKYEDISSMGMLLTDSQRKWVSFLKEAARKKPPSKEIRPKKRLIGLLYDVVTGDKFEVAIMTVIIWVVPNLCQVPAKLYHILAHEVTVTSGDSCTFHHKQAED
ncbi:unnamed protein product [Porites evermanni]|uniref:Ion transport domain-containing protein n=1 Tax=Porites evermanni TaxID=104178 RepID=A0ABN8LL43_9CNID|nr:unnamed protein product [Porites evermanni]